MSVLRYTGVQAVTFIGYGEVMPGGTFPVPDEDAEKFTGRTDIEIVPPEPEPEPVKPVKKSVAVPPVDITEG